MRILLSILFLLMFGCSDSIEDPSAKPQSVESKTQNTINEINEYLVSDQKRKSEVHKLSLEAILRKIEVEEFMPEQPEVAYVYVSDDEEDVGRLVVYWIGETLLVQSLKINAKENEYNLDVTDDYKEYLSEREKRYIDGHAIFFIDHNLHAKLLELQRTEKLSKLEFDLQLGP